LSKWSVGNIGGFVGLSTLDLVSGIDLDTGVTPIKFTSLGDKSRCNNYFRKLNLRPDT